MAITEATNTATRVSVSTSTTQVQISPQPQFKVVINDVTQNKVVISDPSRQDSIERIAPVTHTIRVQDTLRQSVVTDTTTNTIVVNTGLQGPPGEKGDSGDQASDTNLGTTDLTVTNTRYVYLAGSSIHFRETIINNHNDILQLHYNGVTVGAAVDEVPFFRIRDISNGSVAPYTISFRTPKLTSNVTWTFPSEVVTNGVLTTDAANQWSFTDTISIAELTASGDIKLDGNVIARNTSTASFGAFVGDGSQLTNVSASTATTATNANNVYIDYGNTQTTAQLIPTYTADGGIDGYKSLHVSNNPLAYYYRTTNNISGVSQAADELYIGGGANTAGAIFLNSTVGASYPTYIRSDNDLHFKTTGVQQIVSDSPFNISSSFYVDGITDVSLSAGQRYQILGNEHIIFASFTGADAPSNPAIIDLPLVSKSENRQIRFLTDSSLANNSREIHIYPNASDAVLIDNAAFYELERAYDGVMLMCHNGQWWVIQRKSK